MGMMQFMINDGKYIIMYHIYQYFKGLWIFIGHKLGISKIGVAYACASQIAYHTWLCIPFTSWTIRPLI